MGAPAEPLAMGAPDVPAMRLRGLTKSFGTARVLDHVDFDLRPGEIHALLGENGAGKSTLMNILTGIYAADGGTIEIDGTPAAIRSPAMALGLGIGMVHQHFRLAAPFTARENVALSAGALPALRGGGVIEARLVEAMGRTGLEVPLDRPVARLSVAERQRVEILKALSLGARILILDEPTAVLTDEEAERLLKLMRRLAEEGQSIVFITHKLREVMAAADRVSVLRRGRVTLSGVAVAAVTAPDLSQAMIGEAAPQGAPRVPGAGDGAVLAELEAVTALREGGQALRDVSLALRAGEIAGIAGVGGNGQQELAEVLVGLLPAASGSLRIDGVDIAAAEIARRRDLGLRYIPSDRARDALAPNASLAHNLAAGAVREGRLGRRLLSVAALRGLARELIAAFGIAGDTAGGARPVRLLSGGNAQKAVLARELDAGARLIVAHSPTRGLDVAACRYVHDRLQDAAAGGAAVLLISEDLEEIMALCDSIHVMSRGRLFSTPGVRPDRQTIGRLMLGHA